MQLKSLNIKNFRNIKDMSFDIPSESKCVIFGGKNGLGKSTIIDSLLWLLCDETIVYGTQNADNIDKNNRKLPVEVSAIFIKDNGTELKLTRKLTPKFNKQGEFSKYENEPEINDASYSIKQYLARIKNEEFGIRMDNDPEVSSFNTLRCVLDYNYLNVIKYQVAREKIEKILKITKDEDLVNNPTYSTIKDDLKAQLFDIAKVKTKFNKQKDVAELRVKELNESYYNLKNAFVPMDEQELKRLQDIKQKILEKKYEHSAEYLAAMQQLKDVNAKITESDMQYEEIYNKYNNALLNHKRIQENREYYVNQLNALKEKFVTIKNSPNKCPNCNFVLNAKEIQNKLTEINKDGERANNGRIACENELKAINIDSITAEFQKANETHKKLIEEQRAVSSKLNAIIVEEDKQSQIFVFEKTNKLSGIDFQINEIKRKSNVDELQRLENDLKVAREELSRAETKIELLKDFEKAKNQAIKHRINEVFPTLDFRLFEESDTGAITNTCKVFLKNVGYEGINTGHRIRLGYEILKSLRRALGVTESLPFIFDDVSDLDSNNLNAIIDSSNEQIITTKVNDNDEITLL